MNQTSEIEAGLSQSQFERDGYLVLEGHFSPHQVDRAASAIRRLLDERPDEVVAESLRTGRRTSWAQAEAREGRHFKFNDLHLMSGELREMALDPELVPVLGGALGEPPVLFGSQNYQRGGSLRMHIDSLYTTPRSPHSLAAAWVALEDVQPDAGPLFFFPGSHRIPLYRFNDGSHHAAPDEEADWFDYIDVQIRLRGLRQRKFLARKGDVIVLHGDLVHGGSPVRDAGRTRASLVCQYFGESDCRDRNLDIVPLHGGYWMRRRQQAVWVGPAAFDLGLAFPEESYLMRRSDFRDGAEARLVPSGEFRDGKFACGEGRGA
jgi:ectoine hydroxylase-related dioxygenase (phytanoyl-CoA dioxygenase family)